MQECQMMHWKAHIRECGSVTTANNYMFGKPGYTKNKEKYECPPIRYDVVDVKGSKLSLSKTIMGKTGIREFTCEQDILETVIAYFENGRGCSVDIQREADGRDIVSAAGGVLIAWIWCATAIGALIVGVAHIKRVCAHAI